MYRRCAYFQQDKRRVLYKNEGPHSSHLLSTLSQPNQIASTGILSEKDERECNTTDASQSGISLSSSSVLQSFLDFNTKQPLESGKEIQQANMENKIIASINQPDPARGVHGGKDKGDGLGKTRGCIRRREWKSGSRLGRGRKKR